ncbi:MAG: ABC transporter ATP-binding protein [Myxococcota bacterium]|nr:ABC transporter ATP-binding protein [Myxococcota bacterium]
MKKTPIFKVDDLHKVFHIGFFRKRVDAVKGVSFAVHDSEIFGLLGPNGAGKTTLIKSAMGLLRPTRGTVRIFNHNASNKNARAQVGYLPENPYFHEYLTPRELLEFHGRLAGMASKDIARRRDALIEQVGLVDAQKRPLRKFSKGMLQRIGLAQALLTEPKLLVLDEPMSGLDPIGRRFVTDLILDYNKRGTTIIFSSHILSDVERLCHRVVIMNKGHKAAEGHIDDLLKGDNQPQTLEDLFIQKAFS